MENGTGCKRRRQTIHGDEIRKVSKLDPDFEFKRPLPPQAKDGAEPAARSSFRFKAKTSSGSATPKTGRRLSLSGDNKPSPSSKRKLSSEGQVPASGWGSVRRAVVKKDLMPGSLATLHGTVRSELRRRMSSKVLKHKLRNLQDYSLTGPFSAGTSSNNFDLLRQMAPNKENRAAGESNKENQGSGERYEETQGVEKGKASPGLGGKEGLQDTSLDEVWVRRKTPPRKAAQSALSAIAAMNICNTGSPQTSTRSAQKLVKMAAALKDTDLQQKIDHEIKMREGTAKLMAASKHPSQRLEAARTLLCSNSRIIAYMTELQRRKTQEVLGHSQMTEGNQLPCRAQVGVSDIRIPLMWKDTDHFKNKGDYRQYAVFCLLKVGTEIFDTSMITDVDRSMTDITFEDVVLFHNVPHDFDMKVEVYCHKLHEELCVANTPKKIRKKITDISGSVGRSVGKKLSGLNDADVIGNMVLGPRFELVAKGTMSLQDADDSVKIFDFELERNSEGMKHELPLFGNYCCRLAVAPDCLTKPVVSGYLNLQDAADRSQWGRYWCVLKNLQLACWSARADAETSQPVLSIPVTKSTQISDADPSWCQRAHTFVIKTVSAQRVSQHVLSADSKEELSNWWDGFQQHLLDQALWKHACDEVMTLKRPTKNKVSYLRKSSLYEDTPFTDPDTSSDSILTDPKVDDDQLTQMLTALLADDIHLATGSGHTGATS